MKRKEEGLEVKYGLPKEVKFCKKCVMSNQRPSAIIEFKHKPAQFKPTIEFDDEGVCSACRFAEMKEKIDWREREKQLIGLCDKFRNKDGGYDCIVPGSGGKDSSFISHVLKYKYGMNPLTVTWAPHKYTEVGWQNFQNWIQAGFDNYLYSPNGRAHRILTGLAFENLVHPFQPFIIGQKLIGPRFSVLYGIPLVFYGENPAEYGNNIQDNYKPTMDMSYFDGSNRNLDDLFLGGYPIKDVVKKFDLDPRDINPYLPVNGNRLEAVGTQVHYLGYYFKWDPQENFYYATEHTGFKTNIERTEGTYSKYSSFDDKIDPLHYYTTFIKFGIGRATYDASQEIRNKKITREEGISLVKRYDHEFPKKYFKEVLEYMDISEERFWKVIDSARSPHLWKKQDGDWALRAQVA